jgi:hypothetical protein
MKKYILFGISIFILLFLSWCGKTVETTVVSTWNNNISYTNIYTVWQAQYSKENIYWIVISDWIRNIQNNVGWFIKYLNCQPWATVNKDTIIAQIEPNFQDINVQSSLIQLEYISQQINNLSSIYDRTNYNFDLQSQILQDQYENNLHLLDNLQKQKQFTASDMSVQTQSLESQLWSLENSQNIDQQKIDVSLDNFKKQSSTSLGDWLKKVDDTLQIPWIWEKDYSLRSDLENQYSNLKDKLDEIDDMSNWEFSDYLQDFADFFKLTAKVVIQSDTWSSLPQTSISWPSIDSLYTTYINLSNTILVSKSTLDNTVINYDSLENNYKNQINTMDLNLQTLKDNKWELSDIQIDNQFSNINLSVNSVNSQINSLENNRNIQLATLKNQALTLKQNYEIIGNNLKWENLTAWVDGVVKSQNVMQWNRIPSSTIICQISSSEAWSKKLQIFSYKRLILNQSVAVFNSNSIFLWTGQIIYEYPYKDPATQNYIYEMPNISREIKEWEKVRIVSESLPNQNVILIPLPYVQPRLEWNFVKKKSGLWYQETPVILWDIHNDLIEVLNGLNIGDEIVQ